MKLLKFIEVVFIFSALLFSINPVYSNDIIWQQAGTLQGKNIDSFSFNAAGDIFLVSVKYDEKSKTESYIIERSKDNCDTWTSVLERGGWTPPCIAINHDGYIFTATTGSA